MAAEFILLEDNKDVRRYRVINGEDIAVVTCNKTNMIPDLDKDFTFEGKFGWPCQSKRAAWLVRQSIIVKPNNPPKNFVYGVG